MTNTILNQVWLRVDRDREESDASYFLSLCYCGEAITKIVTAYFVAALRDDRSRFRYSAEYRLVRASSVGDWAATLENILTGPASQFLGEEARAPARQLTEKAARDTWQYEAVHLLQECLGRGAQATDLQQKQQGKSCFPLFANLRNKTRGHGAPTSAALSELCPQLERALRLICSELVLFQQPWVYLHRNYSGKYKVLSLSESSGESFDRLKSSSAESYPNGIHVLADEAPATVNLIRANDSVTDFYLPNGSFDDKRFELLSYASGEIEYADASPYLEPPGSLPVSETHGADELVLAGHVLTNAPSRPDQYVHREELETELKQILANERHPVITLTGRGGIGKTTLALSVIYEMTGRSDPFDLVIWFSARDIDLLPHGPKLVRPDVLDVSEMAKCYIGLTGPESWRGRTQDAVELFAEALASTDDGTKLFVFDNFETMSNITETFRWIDTRIRLPNKILITTRTRDFRGDYPLEVRGMSESQALELIEKVARRLRIQELLDQGYRSEIFRQSGGHPYIIKMLLGGITSKKNVKSAKRLLADQDDLLPALFERTFASLSPTAQRLFLTISNWNSSIPVAGLQMVLLRNEGMDVDAALEELQRTSLVEIEESPNDKSLFVATPIAAQIFGKRKLAVSPIRSAVQADTELLHNFGAGSFADIRKGLAPRAKRFVESLGKQILGGSTSLDDALPMLEFLARKEKTIYLEIAKIFEESEARNKVARAKDYVRRYLEAVSTEQDSVEKSRDMLRGWKMLIHLASESRQLLEELNAIAGLASVPNIDFYEISEAVGRFSRCLHGSAEDVDRDEKRILGTNLAKVMERRLEEANATDLSRLAWLKLHLKDVSGAKAVVRRGLRLDEDNIHLRKLAERLARQEGG